MSNQCISEKDICVKYVIIKQREKESYHFMLKIKNVHQNSENINCTECNKSIQKSYVTTHIKLFHSGEKPKYSCKVCTFQTIHSNGVSKHVKNVHQKKGSIHKPQIHSTSTTA